MAGDEKKNNQHIVAYDQVYTTPVVTVPSGINLGAGGSGGSMDYSGFRDLEAQIRENQLATNEALREMATQQQEFQTGFIRDFREILGESSAAIAANFDEIYRNVFNVQPRSEEPAWKPQEFPGAVSMPTGPFVGDGHEYQLRNYFEGLGYNVGYDEATKDIYFNGVPISSSQYRLSKEGHFLVNPGQIKTIQQTLQRQGVTPGGQRFDNTEKVGVRQYLESRGATVDWDPTPGATYPLVVNGKRYSVSGLSNVDDRLYATKAQIYNKFGI